VFICITYSFFKLYNPYNNVLFIIIVVITVYYNTSVVYNLLFLFKKFSTFIYFYEKTNQYINIVASQSY